MRKLKHWAAALLLSTSLTAITIAPARADPISGTIAAIAAFAATPIGGFVVELVSAAAVELFSGLLKNAQGQPALPPSNIGVHLSASGTGTDPQAFIMGHYCTAGTRNYHGTWGTAGGTPNAYYTQEFILSDLPLREITGGWVGDQRITVPDMTGTPPTDQGWPIVEFRDGSTDYMWWRYRDGAQTTPDSFLRAKFGSDADRPYTTDMIGRGRACMVVTMRVNQTFFPSRPDIKFETSGIDLYDVSQDSTAGGDGDQRADDPATWAPSSNLPVHIYNALKGIYWGDEWVFGLQSTNAYSLPAAAWIAAISEANAAIDLKGGGTEPQFAGGAEITVDTEAAAVIQEQLKGCSGRLAEIGGIYKPLVGAPAAPVYSFSDAGVLVTRERSISAFPAIDDTVNGGEASFPDPSKGWVMTDAPAYYRSDLEAEDGGRRLASNLKFPIVSSGTQVQRLIKAAVDEARHFVRPTMVLPPVASELEPLDVVAASLTAEGWTDKKFLITEMDDEPTYQQNISFQEIDPADFDWDEDTDEQPVSVGSLSTVRPPAQVLVGFSAVPATIPDANGIDRRVAITFGWDGDIDDVRAVGFQVRLPTDDDTGDVIYSDSTDNVAAGAVTVASSAFLSGIAVEARGKYYPISGRVTRWSNQDVDGTDGPWLGLTLDNVPFTGLDIAEKTITLNKLADSFQGIVGLLTGDVYNRIADLEDKLGAFAESVSGNIALTQSLISGLSVRNGGAAAAIYRTEVVAIDAMSATATLSDELAVKYGLLSAGGILSWEASAGENGATARVTAKLSIDDGETSFNTGFMYELVPDGDSYVSRTISIADQHYWSDGETGGIDIPMSYVDGVLTVDQLKVRIVSSPDGVTAVFNTLDPEIDFIGS